MRSNRALNAGPTINGVPRSEKKITIPALQAEIWVRLLELSVLARRWAKAYPPPLCSMSATKPPMTASNIRTAALYSLAQARKRCGSSQYNDSCIQAHKEAEDHLSGPDRNDQGEDNRPQT